MYHYYNITARTKIKDRTLHWDDHSARTNQMNLLSYERLRHLFGLSGQTTAASLLDISKYVGTYRTRKQWEERLGINLSTKYISETTKTRIFY